MEERFYDVLAKSEDEHWWYAARREILAWAMTRALEGAPKTGPIYDLGCGVGANLPMLGRFGEVIGLDASERAIAHCHAHGRHNVRRADLERLSGLPLGTGRAALLGDVIEHLDDDAACLDAVHGVLAPGAGLVVTVPAFQALWGPNDDISQHRRRYRRRSLRRVIEQRFTLEHMTYFNSWLLPPVALGRWAQRAMQAAGADVKGGEEGQVPPRAVNAILRSVFASELAVLARGGTFPAGVSLLAIARKR
jgi:SAM-dependent methyltransferase